MHTNKSGIHWEQLASLGALYASIIIGWIAYYNYQPKLLETFHLGHLTLHLFVIQGIILVVTPPIAGHLGDRFRQKRGTRLPVITSGITFAAMVFMAVASALFVQPGETFMQIGILTLVPLWIIAMSLFTSPAISTIELFAPPDKLPRAMAVLVAISGVLYALEPVIIDVLEFIGPPLTFLTGGIAVSLSGYWLRKTTGGDFAPLIDRGFQTTQPRSNYLNAFFLGMGMGLFLTIMFNVFPDWFHTKFDEDILHSGDTMITLMLALSALLALPISGLVEGKRLLPICMVSLLALALLTFIIYHVDNTIALFIFLLLFVMFYTLLSVSALPLSLTAVDYKHRVFGVGIFFAGVEFPNSILEAYLVAQNGGL